MIQYLLRTICKVTGHWFTFNQMWVFLVKTNDRNRDYSATIQCKLCRDTFVSIHAQEQQQRR